jgi:hypothetical protein
MKLVHTFSLLDTIQNERIELFSDFHWADVTETFVEGFSHALFFATQLSQQHFSMDKINHVISSAMEHQNALAANSVTQLLQLHGTLMMEACGIQLT